MTAHALISQNVITQPIGKRQPLRRIVLPVRIAAECNYLPTGHVWWIEQLGRQLYLRAKLTVSHATLEHELAAEHQFVVWHLHHHLSERISWPGTNAERVNVTTAVLRAIRSVSNGFSIQLIDEDTDATLECCRLYASQIVWRYDFALRILERLSKSTFHQRPTFAPDSQKLHGVWAYIRDYFSRAELVQVEECDAYLVATAALLGYEELPTNFKYKLAEEPKYPVDLTFHELDEEKLRYVESIWQKNLSQVANSIHVTRSVPSATNKYCRT